MKMTQETLRILGKSAFSGLEGPARKIARALGQTILKNPGLRVHGKVHGWRVELQVNGSSISIHLKW
jgi:hypothetical protein